ncbi:hypothetical protein niasHS_003430 [Heterodera schachtii]|uniref:GOLD domain-containing protein n=1 Tax=Heterodera schachtii TaxID=97005 RepID=A0ABD2KGI7_HETSC
MTVVVEARRVDCVFQTIVSPKYQSFEIVYQVVEGGDLDITFSMKSPKGFMVANDQRKSDGTYRITLDEPQHGRGDYALCFDNTFSYTSSKRIFFEIFLLDNDGNYLNDFDRKAIQRKDGLLEEHLEVFNRVTTKVKNNLNEIERIQAQFRAIETRDRSAMETAFERVNLWSVVHLFCLLFAAAVQVFLLRSFFLDESLRQIDACRLKEEANECFRRKLFNKAVLLYTRAIEIDPSSSVLWSNRAQAYLNLHRPEKAYMDACGALKREANNSKALFRRALALNRMGLKGRAREDASRCAKLVGGGDSGLKELLDTLRDENDASLIDLTVFHRPEALQSQRLLTKKGIILCKEKC